MHLKRERLASVRGIKTHQEALLVLAQRGQSGKANGMGKQDS